MASNKGYGDFGLAQGGDAGKELALEKCNDCKYFNYKKGSSHPFQCHSGRSDAATRKLIHGQWPTDCEVFEQIKNESKSKSKKSKGGKFSLSKFLWNWLIVSAIAFAAVTVYGMIMQGGGFNIIRAPGAIVGALVGWILRFILVKIFKATTDDWRDKLFSFLLPLIGGIVGAFLLPLFF